jgi:hypothetical protein
MGIRLGFGLQIPFSEQRVAGKFPTQTKQGINSQKQGPGIEQQGSAPDFQVADLQLAASDHSPVPVDNRRSHCVLI